MHAIFFVSVLLAGLALLVGYAHVAIPVVSHYTFETLPTCNAGLGTSRRFSTLAPVPASALVLLLAGNMFRGL